MGPRELAIALVLMKAGDYRPNQHHTTITDPKVIRSIFLCVLPVQSPHTSQSTAAATIDHVRGSYHTTIIVTVARVFLRTFYFSSISRYRSILMMSLVIPMINIAKVSDWLTQNANEDLYPRLL
jgi:hypothetical protein